MSDAEKDLAENFVSMTQAAEQLGVSESRVRKAVISGTLPHVVLFGRKLIRIPDLADYRLRTQPAGEKRVGRPRKLKAPPP